MNIFHRIKKTPTGRSDLRKKSVISRRFIIALSVIYSVLILAVSISSNVIMHTNAETLREALESSARDIMLERSELIVSHLQQAGIHSSDGITRYLQEYNASSGRLIAAIIFTKTSDENYFRTSDMVLFHDNFAPDLKRWSIVQQGKDINYLKKGLVHGTVDPTIYTQDGYRWQNAYYPIEIGKKKAALLLMMSASATSDILLRYADDTRTAKTTLIVITVILILAVVLLTLVFLQNYSLLLSNLSRFMEKAAGGDLNVSLRKTGDDELDQLAQSFNTLIEEMKDLSSRPSAETERGPEPAPSASEAAAPQEIPAPAAPDGAVTGAGTPEDETGILFTTAVAFLKSSQLDDAIAIFRTLTIVKPQSFGSWFNLGVAHAKKREYENAIRMFEEARSLNPSFDVTSQYIDKLKRLTGADA